MTSLEQFRDIVDETLGMLFPPERAARGPILARITASSGDGLACDVRAPDEHIGEVVRGLQARLADLDYTLTIHAL